MVFFLFQQRQAKFSQKVKNAKSESKNSGIKFKSVEKCQIVSETEYIIPYFHKTELSSQTGLSFP